MRLAYFDPVGGASGDMILGALLDAGCPLGAVESALGGLGVAGWRLEARAVLRGGLRATHLVVEAPPDVRFPHLAALLEPVDRAPLPARARARARAILTRLAEAESRVHGVPAEAVHFHEVGAVDTLLDVVGAAAALEALGVDAVHVGPVPLGGGTVAGAHGPLPVPAPATVELLRGLRVHDSGIRAEQVTPTGAAILAALAAPGPLPPVRLETVGHGAGARELPVPNLLRVLVGSTEGPTDTEVETIAAVETTVDDMSPQLYEPLLDRLLEAGALDVHLTPVVMKRSRPGVVVTALAPPDRAAGLAELLFRETTSIGVRWRELWRWRLPRELVRCETTLGPVTFKVSRLAGRPVTVTPEFEEVRRLARERGLPVREVLERVRAEGWRDLGARQDGPGAGA